MEGGKTRIYKQNLSRLIRLPDFFGITDSSGLTPLSRIWDNGVINNGKSPAVKEQEKLSAPTKEKPSVLAQLKAKPVQQQPARRPPTKETGLER